MCSVGSKYVKIVEQNVVMNEYGSANLFYTAAE